MTILFIGDIVGRLGRRSVARVLPRIKKEQKVDLVIANAENAAHGSGVTDSILKELKALGVDFFTAGDHAFKNSHSWETYEKHPIIRPANFPPRVPGQGYDIINTDKGNVLLISLIGRVFMRQDYDCPFRKSDEILANIDLPGLKLSAIIVDIHAEASSEKVALRHYLDGRVTAVLGTHTHIMTADAQVTDQGSAYITDVGMAGAADECLGVEKEGIIRTFLTQIKEKHVLPEKGRAVFNAVLLKTGKNMKAKGLKPITEYTTFK